ncbi:fungal-specific transcription factor domain-containing protein [Zopfochytrium polystomum]|nr:fungal-specific transcription factor domain-containing protein [Zopfochytrium polystomum]
MVGGEGAPRYLQFETLTAIPHLPHLPTFPTRSCEACRLRKRKCDGVRPRCGFCAKKSSADPCVFLGARVRTDVELSRQNQMEIAEKRQKWQAMLGKVDPERHVTPAATAATTTVTSTPLDGMLQQMKMHSIIPPTAGASSSDSPPPSTSSSSSSSSSLPPRPGADSCEEGLLVDAFFHTANMPFPIVHRQSFVHNYAIVSAFLKAAVCAMGASTPTFMALPKAVMLHYYSFARAQSLESGCVETPSLEGVQALLILSAARIQLGMACQMALYLQLDVDPDDAPHLQRLSAVEKETRRRCWWTCYLSERYDAITTTHPPLLGPTTTVRALSRDELWSSPEPNVAACLSTPLPHGSYLHAMCSLFAVHLTILSSRSGACVPSEGVLEPDAAAKLDDVPPERLWASLEAWRGGLPAGLGGVEEEDAGCEGGWEAVLAAAEGGVAGARGAAWRYVGPLYCVYYASVVALTRGGLVRVLKAAVDAFEAAEDDGRRSAAAGAAAATAAAGEVGFARGVRCAAALARMAAEMGSRGVLSPPFCAGAFVLAAEHLTLAEALVAVVTSPRVRRELGLSVGTGEVSSLRDGLLRFFAQQRAGRPVFAPSLELFARLRDGDWSYFAAAAEAAAADEAEAAKGGGGGGVGGGGGDAGAATASATVRALAVGAAPAAEGETMAEAAERAWRLGYPWNRCRKIFGLLRRVREAAAEVAVMAAVAGGGRRGGGGSDAGEAGDRKKTSAADSDASQGRS